MLEKKRNKILVILIFLTLQSFCQTQQHYVYSEGLAPAKNLSDEGKISFGFIDEKGKMVIKPLYDSVLYGFNNGRAVTVKNGEAGMINMKGKTVIPFRFLEISQVTDYRLIPVKDSRGLWGFYSLKGKKAIPCQYNNFRFRDRGIIVVQKNGLWGVIDTRGNPLLGFHYRELEVSPDHYQVIRYNNWELKNMEADTVVRSFSYDSLFAAGEGLLKYYMLGKYGLVDTAGNVVTSYLFDSIGTEEFGKFKVKVWDQYGVIDRNGKEILPARYEDVLIDSLDIRAAVKAKDGKWRWGLFSSEGKEILSPNYPFVGELGENMVPVRAENGIWRYVDFAGSTLIGFKFSEAGPFRNGLAEVKNYMTDSFEVIDHGGKVIISSAEFPFYKSGLLWLDDQHNKIWRISHTKYDRLELLNDNYILVQESGKSGLLTANDKLLVPCQYDYISKPSDEGQIVVRVGDKWGVMDLKGKFTLDLTDKFEKIAPFHEGFARVTIKGRYGFIDSRGNVYISPQYVDAGNVSDGMVSIKINGKWGFVNTDEKLMVQPYYDQVWPFRKGTAIVFSEGRFNLINKNGDELHDPVSSIKITPSGKYLLKEKGKYGLAGENGKEILPVKYDLIDEVPGGYLIVNLRGLYGVLDVHNDIVIPLTYHNITYDPFNHLFICGSERGQEQIRVEGRKHPNLN